VTAGRRVTPAAECFLDNYYLIEDKSGWYADTCLRRYNRNCLILISVALRRETPRVYDLALNLISHSHDA